MHTIFFSFVAHPTNMATVHTKASVGVQFVAFLFLFEGTVIYNFSSFDMIIKQIAPMH